MHCAGDNTKTDSVEFQNSNGHGISASFSTTPAEKKRAVFKKKNFQRLN